MGCGRGTSDDDEEEGEEEKVGEGCNLRRAAGVRCIGSEDD